MRLTAEPARGLVAAKAVAATSTEVPYDPIMATERNVPTRRAGTRVAAAALVGLLVGGVASLFMPWQPSMLVGWDAGATCLIIWIAVSVWWLDPAETERHARSEDTSVRLSELIVLSSGVALLAAVGLVLIRAAHATGGTKASLITLGVLSVALTWLLVHTVFTLRYARTYFVDPRGGVDFNEEDPPTYLDFVYLALTIGMTFQVSDTNLTAKPIRRIALSHALLSYLYGAVIVALVINVVSTLLH